MNFWWRLAPALFQWLLPVAGHRLPAAPDEVLRSRVAGKGASNINTFLPTDNFDYTNYFLNTRKVIPEMLKLFAAHEVHVTWATVGILFHKDKISLLNHTPQLKPAYVEQELSAYHYMVEKGIGEDEESDPFHYAPSLITKILATPFQELATHTFAHYYCNEAGQTPEQFRADLKAAVKVQIAMKNAILK